MSNSSDSPERYPLEPWRSFFHDLDSLLTERVDLHCCGGFVATHVYGVARTTSDVDVIGVVPNLQNDLVDLAGKGSPLHKKHKVYLDVVTIATTPEDYEERLTPIFPGRWTRLHLFALEAHDLALTKLQRNFERDRDDVQKLAQAGHLKPHILEQRYYDELRLYLIGPVGQHDSTLRLWLESYF